VSGEHWNIIRIGEVVAVDFDTCQVKVDFEELEITSDWLPVVQRGAGGAHDYFLPAAGESVVCVFYSDGSEEGVVLGSYYPLGSPPPEAGEGVFYTKYPDGSIVKWDNGQLTITALGGLTINAGTTITGDVVINGKLTVNGICEAQQFENI
jgi:phage baseplate assembly protein V